MAVDDVITDAEFSLANNTEKAVQPASGVEWLITQGMGSNDQNSDNSTWWMVAVDGNQETILQAGETSKGSTGGGLNYQNGALLFTNSQYLSIRNSASGTKTLGFHGIQTK